MEDHPAVMKYRAHEATRLDCMNRHLGKDSQEEDDLLDEADRIWWELSTEEQVYIRRHHGPSHEGIITWLDKIAGTTT